MTTFHARYGLGTKMLTVQEPGLLGDEAETVAQTYDAKLQMYDNTNAGRVRHRWVQNTGLVPLKPGSFVMADVANDLDTDVVQADAAGVAIGIVDPFLTEDVAPQEKFNIIIRALRIPVLVGAVAVVKGARLESNAAGAGVVSATDRSVRAHAAGLPNTLVDCVVAFNEV
jgi:hypothetical protein